jgi:hypothetical protein
MMPSDSPRQTSAEGGRPEDPLDAMSERMRAAQESAERLVREATEAAEQAAAEGRGPRDRPPPRGYATPGSDAPRSSGADLQALVALLDLGRTVLPPELRAQIADLIREILLLVRAIIDWYLERLEASRRKPVEVEDIPIS